jgi:hypothetical protein
MEPRVSLITLGGRSGAFLIADGLIPIASSARELRGVVSAFHDAAREAGRDPGDLMVVDQVRRRAVA